MIPLWKESWRNLWNKQDSSYLGKGTIEPYLEQDLKGLEIWKRELGPAKYRICKGDLYNDPQISSLIEKVAAMRAAKKLLDRSQVEKIEHCEKQMCWIIDRKIGYFAKAHSTDPQKVIEISKNLIHAKADHLALGLLQIAQKKKEKITAYLNHEIQDIHDFTQRTYAPYLHRYDPNRASDPRCGFDLENQDRFP